MYAAPEHYGIAEELGAALRRLLDAAVLSAAGDDDLQAIVAEVNELALRLEGPDGELLRTAMPWPSDERVRRGDRPHNPVIGPANPLSPPMPIRVLEDGSVISEITMRPIHEGPPGAIHGGWVASLLDQLLGIANAAGDVGGMTAELTIRYLKGTPYDVPLTIRARTVSVDGRRVRATGEIVADGVVTAEASGLFIRPSEEHVKSMQQGVKDRLAERA